MRINPSIFFTLLLLLVLSPLLLEWFAQGGGGVFPETWIYDLGADAWTRGPDMITPRHGLAAAVVGDRLYAIAGGEVVSGGLAGATVEVFQFQEP